MNFEIRTVVYMKCKCALGRLVCWCFCENLDIVCLFSFNKPSFVMDDFE